MNAQLTEPIEPLPGPSDPLGRESIAPQPAAPRRVHLTPVDRPMPKPRQSPLFLALTGVVMVLAILAVQLWLSVSISRGAYEANALVVEQRELSRSERVLQQDVEKLSSPQYLAEQAIDLGMVQNAHPAYLQLADGAVLGSLTSNTSDARENLIPNAALASMNGESEKEPEKDEAASDQVETEQADESAAQVANEPLPWEGNLPAPNTH